MAGIVLGVYYGFVLGYFTRSYVYKRRLKKKKLKRVK
ncbi:hypothetical protein SAMN05444673_6708 [Bacillus sp. OV166]|jgi:hypothetical protein|nr:hypothetical protein SAMN05444673_6708 [Bacillus sp. OV166]